jgi:ATP-binding cassette subfamily B protein
MVHRPAPPDRLGRSGIQIWNKSFLDNLTYATEGRGLEGIERAIDAANLRGVLESLPQGLQTHLGESGALLSGGEGQRVHWHVR